MEIQVHSKIFGTPTPTAFTIFYLKDALQARARDYLADLQKTMCEGAHTRARMLCFIQITHMQINFSFRLTYFFFIKG